MIVNNDSTHICGYAVRLIAKPGTYDAGNTYVLGYTFQRYRYKAEEEKKRIRKWAAKGHRLAVVKVCGSVTYTPPEG